MHSDERVELKILFYSFLQEKGWDIYLKKESRIQKIVNFFFRILHILCVISILGLAFSSMRDYIPRMYGWVALGMVFVWILIERLNLQKVDDFFMKKTRKKLISILMQDDQFIAKVAFFEKLDIVPEGTIEKLNIVIQENKYNEVIESIKRIDFFLKAVRTLEENQRELNQEEKRFVPEDYDEPKATLKF